MPPAPGELPVPMELMPLLAGLTGLGFAIVFGYIATKQRSTAFAMITLGIVQLVTTAATMFIISSAARAASRPTA